MLPFEPFHGTRGTGVPCILKARLVRRSSRLASTLDNRYAVCLGSLGTVASHYTDNAPLKATFQFNVFAHRKCNNFKSNGYLYAHESWISMKYLTLISAGARIHGPHDFLAAGGVYHPEPLRAIEAKDVPDDWRALPEAFLREYGQFR